MKVDFTSPINESNIELINSEMQKAIVLRQSKRVDFYCTALMRVFLFFFCCMQLFMLLFSELKFIMPEIYDFLNELFIEYPKSLGLNYIIVIMICVAIVLLLPYLTGYCISEVMRRCETRGMNGNVAHSESQFSQKITELGLLIEKYKKDVRGDTIAAIILTAAAAVSGLAVAVISGENFTVCLASFAVCGIIAYVLVITGNYDVIPDNQIDALTENYELLNIKIRKHSDSVRSDEPHCAKYEVPEDMTGDELYDYAIGFLGANTKKCIYIMEKAEEKGCAKARNFLYTTECGCEHFSQGVCLKYASDGKIEHCYHDDGTWIMCEYFDKK